MWKRNVVIGLTSLLVILTTVSTITNVKQQKRIDALESIRESTATNVETEIQRYLNANAAGLMITAVEDSGLTPEDLVNDSVNSLVSESENGHSITMEFTESQKADLAKKIAEITYDNVSQEVLSGQKEIDVDKLESEVANAVTDILTSYIDKTERQYVTVEGDTNAIVAQVVEQLNAKLIAQNNDNITADQIKSMISEDNIKKIVSEILNNSSVTKENVNTFKDSVIKETVSYLQQYNIIQAGKDGINGKDGKDGKDAELTDADIATIKSEIIGNIQNDEGLQIYGKSGRGITNAYIDGRNLYLETAVQDVDGQNIDEDVIEVKDIVGNSLLAVTTEIYEQTSMNAVTQSADIDFGSNTFNTAYEIIYYTEFPTKDGQAPDNESMYCNVDGLVSMTDITQENGTYRHGDHTACQVYKNSAGVISLDDNQIKELVTTIKESIVKSLETSIGGTDGSISNTFESMKKIEETIKTLQESIDGKDTKLGLDTLVNGTDPNKTGSLTDYVSKAQDIQNRLSKIDDQISGSGFEYDSDGDGIPDKTISYSEVYEMVSKAPEYATVNAAIATEVGAYYVVTVDYEGSNSAPNVSLIGAERNSAVVPSKEQSQLWSMCKYIKIDTNAHTASFYFADDSVNKKVFDTLKTATSLYIAFSNTGIPNGTDTMVLTNNTTNNYGSVRVSDFDSSSNTLNLTGYQETDTLNLTDLDPGTININGN